MRVIEVKGSVAGQILANAVYVFFWTRARKQMDLIKGSQRLNLCFNRQRALAFA